MTVIVLEKVPGSLRGYLSRWLIEIHTGTFVGKLSQRVRKNLWEEVCSSLKTGSAFIVYGIDTEQGYKCDFWGYPSRRVKDFDGLQLIEIYDIPASQARKAARLEPRKAAPEHAPQANSTPPKADDVKSPDT